MAVCDEHIICDTLHAWLNLTLKAKRKRKPYPLFLIKYSD